MTYFVPAKIVSLQIINTKMSLPYVEIVVFLIYFNFVGCTSKNETKENTFGSRLLPGFIVGRNRFNII